MHNFQSEIYGDLGRQLTRLGNGKNHMILCGGAVRFTQHQFECDTDCCQCCGDSTLYEIIPRHLILGFKLINTEKFSMKKACGCWCLVCLGVCREKFTGVELKLHGGKTRLIKQDWEQSELPKYTQILFNYIYQSMNVGGIVDQTAPFVRLVEGGLIKQNDLRSHGKCIIDYRLLAENPYCTDIMKKECDKLNQDAEGVARVRAGVMNEIKEISIISGGKHTK